jgi:hypothetical protein
MDIVDSIMTASAAAVEASAYIRERKNGHALHETTSHEKEVAYA